jgi:hypothetical protein
MLGGDGETTLEGPYELARAASGVVLGELGRNYLGSAVSSAGDVNGDGYSDLLIGAPGYDGGGTSLGKAYLVLGPLSGTLDAAEADGQFLGSNNGDEIGEELAGVGDMDGDGLGDVAFGGPTIRLKEGAEGQICVFYGPVSGVVPVNEGDLCVNGAEESDKLGAGVSGADVSGDGLSDLLISAIGVDAEDINGAGVLYVINGVSYW